jgi:hypothetical protein
MNCNYKTMIKLAIGLGVGLAVAYFALPEFQAFILASAPLLVALICPVAMVLMMLAMKGSNKDGSAKPGESGAHAEVRDAAPDKQ